MSFGDVATSRRRRRTAGRRRLGPLSDRLSLGVAARLSRYLQVLTQARKMGKETISSQELSRVHARQLDADPPRPLGLRQVRQARRGLQRRLAGLARSARSCGPRGQHNIALFGAGHLGKAIASLGHLRRPRLPRRGDLRHRPRRRSASTIGPASSSATPTTSSRSSRRRTSSSACSPSRPPPPRSSPTSSSTPGVKIIFNYSEALLQVPPEVTVHTSSPAVDLLYALYFYLT